MSTRLSNEVPEAVQPLLDRFLAELEAAYPVAKGHTEISVERDGTIFVCVPWSDDDDELIRITEHMAKVATNILVETGQNFMLLPTQELSSN